MEACWLKTDQLILAGWNLSHGRMKVRRIDKTLQISRQTKVNNAEDYLFKSLTPFVKWLLKRTWHLVTQWYDYNCIFLNLDIPDHSPVRTYNFSAVHVTWRDTEETLPIQPRSGSEPGARFSQFILLSILLVSLRNWTL